MTRPEKWSERAWCDAFEGPQFRTYRSPRNFQVCLSVTDFQGDGMFHLSVHVLRHALAFEFPFTGEHREINWSLCKPRINLRTYYPYRYKDRYMNDEWKW